MASILTSQHQHHNNHRSRTETLKDRLKFFFDSVKSVPYPKHNNVLKVGGYTHLARKYENSEALLRKELRKTYWDRYITNLFLTHEQWKTQTQEQYKVDQYNSIPREEKKQSTPSQETNKKLENKVTRNQEINEEAKNNIDLAIYQAKIETLKAQHLKESENFQKDKRDLEQQLQEQLKSQHEQLDLSWRKYFSDYETKTKAEIRKLEESNQNLLLDLNKQKRDHTHSIEDLKYSHSCTIINMGNKQTQQIQEHKEFYENKIRTLNSTVQNLRGEKQRLEVDLTNSNENVSSLSQQLNRNQHENQSLVTELHHKTSTLTKFRNEKTEITTRLTNAIHRRGESKRKENSESKIYIKLSDNATSNHSNLDCIIDKLPINCVVVNTPEEVPDNAELFLFTTFLNGCRMTPSVSTEFQTFQGRGKNQDIIFLVGTKKTKDIDEEGLKEKFPQLRSAGLSQICIEDDTLRTNEEANVAFQKLILVVEKVFPGIIGPNYGTGEDVLVLLDELGI